MKQKKEEEVFPKDLLSGGSCLYKCCDSFLSNIIKFNYSWQKNNMNIEETDKAGKQADQNESQSQQKVNSTSKPFLSKFNSKSTPICMKFHQVDIPDILHRPHNLKLRKQQLAKTNDALRPQPTFLATKIKEAELEEYLSFAQKYFQDKISDYFSTGNDFFQ